MLFRAIIAAGVLAGNAAAIAQDFAKATIVRPYQERVWAPMVTEPPSLAHLMRRVPPGSYGPSFISESISWAGQRLGDLCGFELGLSTYPVGCLPGYQCAKNTYYSVSGCCGYPLASCYLPTTCYDYGSFSGSIAAQTQVCDAEAPMCVTNYFPDGYSFFQCGVANAPSSIPAFHSTLSFSSSFSSSTTNGLGGNNPPPKPTSINGGSVQHGGAGKGSTVVVTSIVTKTKGGGTGGTTTNNNSGGSSTPIGAIVGGAVGGVAVLIIIVVLALFLYRRYKKKQREKQQASIVAPGSSAQSPGMTGASAYPYSPQFQQQQPDKVPFQQQYSPQSSPPLQQNSPSFAQYSSPQNQSYFNQSGGLHEAPDTQTAYSASPVPHSVASPTTAISEVSGSYAYANNNANAHELPTGQ